MNLPKRFTSLLLLLSLAVSVFPQAHASNHVSKQFATRSHAVIADNKARPKPMKWEDAVAVRGGASNTNAVTGAVVMLLLENVVKKTFKAQGISFPSQLGGCIILFAVMLLAELVSPGLGDSIFNSLTPGSALLAKWLPVFFVPGLAMLPLAPSIGSSLEIAKVILVVLVGWVYSLCTVTFGVLALRTSQGTITKAAEPEPPVNRRNRNKKEAVAPAPKPAKPYSDETMNFLMVGSLISGAVSVIATRTKNDLATPLQTIFHFLSTVAAYVWGARLPAAFNKIVHPLVTSTILQLVVIRLTGMLTGSEFLDVLRTYKVGSLDPMKTGAGDQLLNLLGPAVVSFAISMYSRKKLLKENFLVVVTAMLISSAGGLYGTAAFCRLISLGGPTGRLVRLSVLSRNVTTALAMAITDILKGDIAIAASVVVLTGIVGATYGRSVLTAMGVTDPVSRGLGIGASSQGLGVASMVSEADAFPFAAMSMVLTAISATVIASIPATREALIQLAVGKPLDPIL